MQTTVSFPGLGIEEFSFSRVAFTLFGRPVYWYGVLIMLGIVVAFCHALWRARAEKIKSDHVFDLAIWIVLCGVVGARLYYVLTTWGDGRYKSFLDVIAIWEGGLAIYGGVIAGALAILGVCRYKKINPLKIMDMVAPSVMIAQAIGRWGNFCNGEAFGEVVAEGSLLYPFRMGLVSEFAHAPMQYYHPTFLYESLWNVVGFVIITALYRKKKFNGQVVLMYLTWYGFGRMFIEGLRTDSLYVGPFRISQVVGLICFVCGAALLMAGLILQRKGKLGKIYTVDLLPAGEQMSEETCQDAPQEADEKDVDIAEDGEETYESCFGSVSADNRDNRDDCYDADQPDQEKNEIEEDE